MNLEIVSWCLGSREPKVTLKNRDRFENYSLSDKELSEKLSKRDWGLVCWRLGYAAGSNEARALAALMLPQEEGQRAIVKHVESAKEG